MKINVLIIMNTDVIGLFVIMRLMIGQRFQPIKFYSHVSQIIVGELSPALKHFYQESKIKVLGQEQIFMLMGMKKTDSTVLERRERFKE